MTDRQEPAATRRADIRLVCFDLGDVLVRICHGWKHAFEAAGLTSPAGELDAARRTELLQAIALNEVDAIDQAEFARRAAALFDVAEADVCAALDAYLLGPYEGVEKLVDDLDAAGVRTATLSNTNARHWRLMTEAGGRCYLPLDRMTHRFASHLTRARKPEAAIYEHVEREAGLPAETILFFDNLEENIAAARQRGWHGEVIMPDEEPVVQIRRWLARYDVLLSNGSPPTPEADQRERA